MDGIRLVMEFLCEYNINGFITVNDIVEKLYDTHSKKYYRLRHKNYLSKLLNILDKRGYAKHIKHVRNHYINNRYYNIYLDKIKNVMESGKYD